MTDEEESIFKNNFNINFNFNEYEYPVIEINPINQLEYHLTNNIRPLGGEGSLSEN